jgi:VanZ family protein
MNPIQNNVKRVSLIRFVLIVMLIGWMALIFIKSNEPYQTQNIQPFLEEWIPHSLIDNRLPHVEFYYSGDLLTWKKPYILLEFFFRKSAHVTEFAVLTMLWMSTLHYTTMNKYKLLLGPILVVLYAASDEWHQSFIVGRTGHAIDVAVDSIGMLLVVFVLLGLKWWRNRKKGEVHR